MRIGKIPRIVPRIVSVASLHPSVHGFLVLSSGIPDATQGSVISKTVWVAKTTATIAAPNIAEAVETVETVQTVWGQ